MKFSICIPNYNYERYLGLTIQSVLDQSHQDFEILVSDNASTDGSVALVRGFRDPRIQLHINASNLGYPGNLDPPARMANGDRLIMLSSDDLMGPEALATYEQFCRLLPDHGRRAIISSGEYQIDSNGQITADLGLAPAPFILPSERVPALEAAMGARVYRVAGGELLRRSVLGMRNPIHFATLCYPRQLYEQVGGYSSSRMVVPDKWFNWKLMGAADEAYFIDRPLFSYRWHSSNQFNQEKRSGILKQHMDEYRNSVELTDEMLAKSRLTRADVERAFVDINIGNHGWVMLGKDGAFETRRIVNFGKGVFPKAMRGSRKVWLLRAALPFSWITAPLARRLYGRYTQRVAENRAADAAQAIAPSQNGSRPPQAAANAADGSPTTR